MSPDRFREITDAYASLRIVLVGDFCLDRYLEIDPARTEVSIETGLPVHNVVHVRSQPGAAGTILNNLVALGVGRVELVGMCGDDGEGYELRRALTGLRGVGTEGFLTLPDRRTFTYCKPLMIHPGRPPEELNRLDSKNWSPTPRFARALLGAALRRAVAGAHAVVVLDQVDLAETGVVTGDLQATLGELAAAHPEILFLADSRRGLRGWPALGFKMNAAELAALEGRGGDADLESVRQRAGVMALRQRRPVFVTLAERGIVGADAQGQTDHRPSLPLRGPIDVVGAGDSVMAGLAASLAAGAQLGEALELAMAGASLVVHQLGTTGTADVPGLRSLLFP